jgi:DNA-binding transcriptional MerR regulator
MPGNWSERMNNLAHCMAPSDDRIASLKPEQPANDAEQIELSGTELTKRWGVTMRALRFYESRGLISPRRVGRARTYDQLDSQRIGLILRAKKLGFTLAEIGQMIDVKDGAAAPGELQLTAQKCLQQIVLLEGQMKNLIEALADLRQIHLQLCRRAAADT